MPCSSGLGQPEQRAFLPFVFAGNGLVRLYRSVQHRRTGLRRGADFPVLRNFAAPVKTFSLFGWPIFRIEESLEKARWPPALLRENT